MDTKKQVEAALLVAEKDRKWLAEASGYSYYSVRDCLAPEGKKLSKRMFAALMDAIARAADAPPSPPDSLPDRITLFVDPEKHALWDAAAKDDEASPNTAAWAVAKLNEAAEAWASGRELHLLPSYAADASDGENRPKLGNVNYGKKRSK